MTYKKPDWADEIENRIADEYASHGAILAADADGMIAAALRKAKADGMREAAGYAFTSYRVALNDLADKIEKGKQ